MGKILASSFAFCQFLHVNSIWRWKYRTFSFMEWSPSYLSLPHSESRKTLEPTNAMATFILIYPHGLIFALWYILMSVNFGRTIVIYSSPLQMLFYISCTGLWPIKIVNVLGRVLPASLPVIFTELFLSWASPEAPCSPISRSYQYMHCLTFQNYLPFHS